MVQIGAREAGWFTGGKAIPGKSMSTPSSRIQRDITLARSNNSGTPGSVAHRTRKHTDHHTVCRQSRSTMHRWATCRWTSWSSSVSARRLEPAQSQTCHAGIESHFIAHQLFQNRLETPFYCTLVCQVGQEVGRYRQRQCVSGVSYRAVRVGYTQSYMSTPRAVHTTRSSGYPTPMRYRGLSAGSAAVHLDTTGQKSFFSSPPGALRANVIATAGRAHDVAG
jgi:hypothetical protein